MPRHRTGPDPAARVSGFLLVALGAALWGSDALFRRGLALDLPSTTVVVYEHLVLAAVTAPLLWRGRSALRRLDRGDLVALAVIGAGASATATLLFTAAFRYGDPTTPLLLQKLQPLVAVGAAALLLGERLRPRFGPYLLIAVAAAFLVSVPDPRAVTLPQLLPAALAAGAATLWGLGTVLGRRLRTKVDALTLTSLRFAIGLPAAAVFVLVDEGPGGFTTVAADDVVPLLLLALVPGLVALVVYYRGLGRTPAALATVAELAFPLAAVVLNRLAFGVTLTPTQWLGAAALTAVIVATSTVSRRRDARTLGVAAAPTPVAEPV